MPARIVSCLLLTECPPCLPLPPPLQDAPGCHEFLLQDDGKWLHVKETENIGEAALGAAGTRGYWLERRAAARGLGHQPRHAAHEPSTWI